MSLTSQDALTTMAEVGGVIPLPDRRLDLRVVVTFVEA